MSKITVNEILNPIDKKLQRTLSLLELHLISEHNQKILKSSNIRFPFDTGGYDIEIVENLSLRGFDASFDNGMLTIKIKQKPILKNNESVGCFNRLLFGFLNK